MNTTPSSTPRISSTTTSDGIAVTRTPQHGNWPTPDQQVDATRQSGNSNKRALVLAGGGAAGNAWEHGLIAGLSDGRDEIRAWLGRSASEYTYTSDLIDARQVDDTTYVATHHLEGNVPGGTVDLDFTFARQDGLVTRLVIA